MIGRIWERYFIYEMLKTFFFFIVCFYGLYILIDYVNHATSSHSHHANFTAREFIVFYLAEFIRRAEIIIPFGLLLATTKTLCQLNSHNELVALLASGVSRLQIIRPLLFIGFLFTLLVYTSTEYWYPGASKFMESIQNTHHMQRLKKGEFPEVPHMVLQDGSLLLYKRYDAVAAHFEEVYWVLNADELVRMQIFYPLASPPFGVYVEKFSRKPNGEIALGSAEKISQFPDLIIDKKTLFDRITPPATLSISALTKKAHRLPATISEKEAATLTTLYQKISLPWLCLLAVLAPAPYCISFSRNFQVFFIYALGIFGLVALYLVLDASAVMGKRLILTPFNATITPLLAAFAVALYPYIRMK